LLQETWSTTTLSRLCALSDKLDESDIHAGDKTPSWDGNIIYFADGKGKGKVTGNESLIPIQVKGKEYVKLPPENSISYPVRRCDLSNYYNNGGILYIVDAIEKNTHTEKLFVRVLMPIDIQPLLKGKSQKRATITLHHIPDWAALQRLCEFFLNNRHKQSILLSCDVSHNLTHPDGFALSGITLSSQVSANAISHPIFNADQQYAYAIQSGVYFPIDKYYISASRSGTITLEIDNSYKTELDYYSQECSDYDELSFNNIIKLIFDKHTQLTKITDDFNKSRKLSETYPVAKMILAIRENRHVILRGEYSASDCFGSFVSSLPVERLDCYRFLIQMCEVCVALKIPLNQLTIDDVLHSQSELKKLREFIIEGKEADLPINKRYQFFYQPIGSKSLFLYAHRTEDGKYKLENVLDINNHSLTFSCKDHDSMISVKKWHVITPSILPSLLFDRAAMLDDIRISPNALELNNMTSFVLAMLHDYDTTHNAESLEFAKQLHTIIEEHIPSDPTTIINQCQINFRNNELDDRDLDCLTQLKFSENVLIAACAALLLRQQTDFNVLFDRMTPEQRDAFTKWPIYTLNKNINSVDEMQS